MTAFSTVSTTNGRCKSNLHLLADLYAGRWWPCMGQGSTTVVERVAGVRGQGGEYPRRELAVSACRDRIWKEFCFING